MLSIPVLFFGAAECVFLDGEPPPLYLRKWGRLRVASRRPSRKLPPHLNRLTAIGAPCARCASRR